MIYTVLRRNTINDYFQTDGRFGGKGAGHRVLMPLTFERYGFESMACGVPKFLSTVYIRISCSSTCSERVRFSHRVNQANLSIPYIHCRLIPTTFSYNPRLFYITRIRIIRFERIS